MEFDDIDWERMELDEMECDETDSDEELLDQSTLFPPEAQDKAADLLSTAYEHLGQKLLPEAMGEAVKAERFWGLVGFVVNYEGLRSKKLRYVSTRVLRKQIDQTIRACDVLLLQFAQPGFDEIWHTCYLWKRAQLGLQLPANLRPSDTSPDAPSVQRLVSEIREVTNSILSIPTSKTAGRKAHLHMAARVFSELYRELTGELVPVNRQTHTNPTEGAKKEFNGPASIFIHRMFGVLDSGVKFETIYDLLGALPGKRAAAAGMKIAKSISDDYNALQRIIEYGATAPAGKLLEPRQGETISDFLIRLERAEIEAKRHNDSG